MYLVPFFGKFRYIVLVSHKFSDESSVLEIWATDLQVKVVTKMKDKVQYEIISL